MSVTEKSSIGSNKHPAETRLLEGMSLGVESIEIFLKIVEDTLSKIEECKHSLGIIQEAQKLVQEHSLLLNSTVKKNRMLLETETAAVIERLNKIRLNITIMEPSKPKVSHLDTRNQKFKLVLRSYKDILEQFISLTLENQRSTSQLFEDQIKAVNPNATPFDLERAINSTNEDCPSVFVQVLMQRGVRKNDKELQRAMVVVQDISQDLRLLNISFTKLTELRNEANIIIERYRRRWPVFLQEGNYIYIIDDNLNLIERTVVGITIDFDVLLRQRERRNRMRLVLLATIVIFIVIAFIIVSALFSEF